MEVVGLLIPTKVSWAAAVKVAAKIGFSVRGMTISKDFYKFNFGDLPHRPRAPIAVEIGTASSYSSEPQKCLILIDRGSYDIEEFTIEKVTSITDGCLRHRVEYDNVYHPNATTGTMSYTKREYDERAGLPEL